MTTNTRGQNNLLVDNFYSSNSSVSQLLFPVNSPGNVRVYSSGKALYIDDTANGNIILDVKGEIRQNGVTSGDLMGPPGGSTDNAITRFDGTTGKLVQNSSATIDDAGAITVSKAMISNALGEVLTLGNNTDLINTSPVSINMGGSRSGVNGSSSALKLKLWSNGTAHAGIGSFDATQYYFINTDGYHDFFIGASKPLSVATTGITAPKATLSATTGDVLTIGAGGVGGSSPASISLGPSFYGNATGYDKAGLKLKIFDYTATEYAGIGITSGYINYVIHSGNQHRFYVGNSMGLLVSGTSVTTPKIVTTGTSNFEMSQANYGFSISQPVSGSAGIYWNAYWNGSSVVKYNASLPYYFAFGDIAYGFKMGYKSTGSETIVMGMDTDAGRLTAPLGLAIAKNSGETLKIGTVAVLGTGVPTPAFMTLGNSFYNGVGSDYAGLKLRICDASNAAYGIGVTGGSMNYVAPTSGDVHRFYSNTTNSMTISNTTLTLPTNTGEVIKIGNNSNQTNGTAAPININLGDSYYATAGGLPYDKAALKIRMYDNGLNYSGIGLTTSQMNYVTNETTNHVFYVNGGERLRINQNGISTAFITTGTGDLSLSAAGSNITLNGKNLTGVGSISMPNATGPRITLWTNFNIGVGTSHINYNVPVNCYHAITTNGSTRLQVEDGGVIANVPIQTTSIRATSTTGGTINFNGATAANLIVSGITAPTTTVALTLTNTTSSSASVSYCKSNGWVEVYFSGSFVVDTNGLVVSTTPVLASVTPSVPVTSTLSWGVPNMGSVTIEVGGYITFYGNTSGGNLSGGFTYYPGRGAAIRYYTG